MPQIEEKEGKVGSNGPHRALRFSTGRLSRFNLAKEGKPAHQHAIGDSPSLLSEAALSTDTVRNEGKQAKHSGEGKQANPPKNTHSEKITHWRV